MWQRTIIKTVDSDKLIESLQKEINSSKNNNENLVIRELDLNNDKCSLILDSKKKVDYDIELTALKNVKEVIDKIDELKVKKEYWKQQLNDLHMNITTEEYCRHSCERQYEHFEGAIHALEYILGDKEI